MQQAFDLFVDSSDARMPAPFVIGDYTYASNGYRLIRCPNSLIDFEFTPPENHPDATKIIKPNNVLVDVLIDSINWEARKTEFEEEKISDEVKCGHCHGEGTLEDSVYYKDKFYHCEYDCPVCKGSGVEEEAVYKKTGNLTFAHDTEVSLLASTFWATNIYVLKQVQDILGGEITLVNFTEKNKSFSFEIGDVYILLMPTLSDEDISEMPRLQVRERNS